MAAKRGKMLVIRGGAIGDFILTLPALAALRTTFPNTHLELLGYPVVAELARAAGTIDAFRSIEARPLARFFAKGAELDPEWSDYFESFNLIISYLFDPDQIFKTNVGRVSKAQFIQARHRPDEKEAVHATAVFLKPLEQLAIFDADAVPRLALSPSEALPAGRWIAVHPGSGSEKKNWPVGKWIELLRVIGEWDQSRFLVVGGEAEGEKLDRVAGDLPRERIRVARNLPLSQLAGLIKQCAVFAGHDSGITHLAAALGVPVLALWGPSTLNIWRPLNSNVQILNAGVDLASLNVAEVSGALRNLLRIE